MHYTVDRIASSEAKKYIRENHYSRSCHNGPSPCYGLFDGEVLIGVLCFATPCSENVRSWALGPDEKDATVELHRLFIEDVTPKNAETFFISRCLKRLKADRPKTKIVVSFSDSTQGHSGTIYAAANFIRTGSTGRAVFYRDATGALRHPRQNGVNISKETASEWGWTPERRESKTRWHYPLGATKSETRALRRLLIEKAEARG